MRINARNIDQKHTTITEHELKNGLINVFSCVSGDVVPNLYRTTGVAGDVRSAVQSLSIDPSALFDKLTPLPRHSVRIYYHLLSLLTDNRKAIKIHNTQLKTAATILSKRETFTNYLDQLLESELVIRYRSHEFYINPLYAWVGDQSKYFDPDYIPFYVVHPKHVAKDLDKDK